MKNLSIFVVLSICLINLAYAQNEKIESQTIDKMKPALIVIDIQNDYLPYMAEDEKKIAMQVINGAIWLFRENNLSIIRVYHSDINSGSKEGSEGFEYPKSVRIQDSDTKIHKHYPSAFTKTNLNKVLKQKDCNTLFLCGLSATACVLATYFGGLDLGYETFMIKDAIMSPNPAHTDVIKEICESVGFETMRFMVDKRN
jgi:nicotinamidase-related amidase